MRNFLESANNNEKSLRFIDDLDTYQYWKYNLWVVFDRFVEGNQLCKFIQNTCNISDEAKKFLIYFIKKDGKVSLFDSTSVIRIYSELQKNFSMTESDIATNIPYFWRFLETKNILFREHFVQLVNKELKQYIVSIFEIHFNENNWEWFDFIKQRNQNRISQILSSTS